MKSTVCIVLKKLASFSPERPVERRYYIYSLPGILARHEKIDASNRQQLWELSARNKIAVGIARVVLTLWKATSNPTTTLHLGSRSRPGGSRVNTILPRIVK